MAEDARRERRDELLEALVAASPAAIVTVDPEFRITMWNPAAERMFGWRADEVLGRLSPIIPEQERGVLARQLASRSAVRDRATFAMERARLRKDGTTIEVSISAAPLLSPSGEPRGAVAVIMDATERKALEAQLRQSQKLEALGQLAGGVAHDFNNLLTVVRLQTSILLEALPSSDPKCEDLLEIQRATDRAASLTSQLLAFGRRQMLRPEALDVAEVIAGIVPMVRRLIGEDIEIRTRGQQRACITIADRGQLEQMLVNLAINARDAMPRGGVLSIETQRVPMGHLPTRFGSVPSIDYVMVTVSDTGFGMEADIRSHIFEPFFTTKPPEKGTGLGLSTVYGIVRQSGGHIAFDSVPGSGTTFWIILPFADVSTVALAPEAVPPRGGPEAILVVEDEDAVRALVSRILAQKGYDVVDARGGGEAMSVLERRRDIRLILTDVVMPGMNGSQLREHAHAIAPGIPVLFMSGYTNDEVARRAGTESQFIAKPFTASDLQRAVRRMLDLQTPGVMPGDSSGTPTTS